MALEDEHGSPVRGQEVEGLGGGGPGGHSALRLLRGEQAREPQDGGRAVGWGEEFEGCAAVKMHIIMSKWGNGGVADVICFFKFHYSFRILCGKWYFTCI